MSQGIVRSPSYVVRCGEDHAAIPERGSFCALRVRVGEEMAGTRDRTFAVVQYRVSRPTVAVDAAPATISGEPCLVVAGQLPQQLRRRLQLAGEAGDLGGGVSATVLAAGVVEHRGGQGNALTRHRSPPYPRRGRGGRNTDRIRGPHNPWRSGPCPSAS